MWIKAAGPCKPFEPSFCNWLWVKTQKTPGEHPNRWQMDVHPPQKWLAIASAPGPIGCGSKLNDRAGFCGSWSRCPLPDRNGDPFGSSGFLEPIRGAGRCPRTRRWCRSRCLECPTLPQKPKKKRAEVFIPPPTPTPAHAQGVLPVFRRKRRKLNGGIPNQRPRFEETEEANLQSWQLPGLHLGYLFLTRSQMVGEVDKSDVKGPQLKILLISAKDYCS